MRICKGNSLFTCLACCDKAGSARTDTSLLMVLDAGSLRSRCHRDWFQVRPLFWLVDSHLLAVSSHGLFSGSVKTEKEIEREEEIEGEREKQREKKLPSIS